jgi:hypothetical protein
MIGKHCSRKNATSRHPSAAITMAVVLVFILMPNVHTDGFGNPSAG